MALPEVDELEQATTLTSLEFTVTHQEVDLDVDLVSRRITGRATITIQPLIKELQRITLNCRELDIKNVTVDGHVAKLVDYDDPGRHINPRKGYGLLQHHLIDGSLTDAIAEFPDGELKVTLPTKVKIKEMSQEEQAKMSSDALDSQTLDFLQAGGTLYRSLKLQIDYIVSDSRDALHWVGLTDDDERFPHMYTRHQALPGDTPSFVFPCLDSLSARCTWRLAVRCPRTLGDLDRPAKKVLSAQDPDGSEAQSGPAPSHRRHMGSFTEDERILELSVVSSGYMEDSDAPGEADDNKRKWMFGCSTPISAHFVGFAIGPFEQVDLSNFRESDQDEKLGDSAVKLHAFCLPGRADEVRNTCQPLTLALDFFTEVYGSYPFPTESTSHKLCFVDDLPQNVLDMASLSLVTPRLLFPPEIIDNMYENLRELVHALANQWLGVNIVPSSFNDQWVIVGGSWYMADSFMTKLAGRNEHRFRQRLAADRVIEMDLKRPSLYAIGPFINLSPSNLEFVNLKAPLILFILDNRIIKSSGRNGVSRMFWKLLLDAKTGKIINNQISTLAFMRICEKVGHVKLDTFFQQWVYGSGCPTFAISQRFNKKKLTVEMIITQRAVAAHMDLKVEPSIFMREAKENEQEDLYAGEVQPVFTGPMTVRIIEMDGTPYEHIVEIRENLVKFDIPYNTKYKRLKQRKRQKEAATAGGGQADGEESQDRSTIYRLGNILPESDTTAMTAWKLRTWNDEDDKQMKEDFAEWVRIDKDFEWICRIMPSQPTWMYAAQLSQDNDVAAHMESIKFFSDKKHYMAPTFLVRTLMDNRYFHGVRVQAAEALAQYASVENDPDRVGLFHLQKAFNELFCVPDSGVTRPNDFTDRAAYVLQCAIPKALAKIRDSDGKVPDEVRTFFIDKMKFNDNANNDFSDNYYVATLLSCMARTFNKPKEVNTISFDFGGGDSFEQETAQLGFQKIIIDELDRHRRIDEWIPSFQNLYTLTALECATVMMKEQAIPRRYADIIKYTKVGNADQVRLKGFECLIELDAFRSSQMRAYFMYSFSSDPSPYMRDRLWEVIGRGLGVIATTAPPDTQQASITGALSFDDNDVDRRQEAFARNTIEGALKSVKGQLADDPLLQNVLFEALQSSNIGFRDAQNLLVVCRMLYPTKDSLIFQRRLPRFWAVNHLGKGKLRFYETDRIRKEPRVKVEPLPILQPKVDAPMKLNFKLGAPKRPREETAEPKAGRPVAPAVKRQRTASPETKGRESGVKRVREDGLDNLPLAQQGPQDFKRQRLAAEEKHLSRASSPSVDSIGSGSVVARTDINAAPKPKLIFKSRPSMNGTNGVTVKPTPPKPANSTSQAAAALFPRPFDGRVKLKFTRLKDKLRAWPRGKSGHRPKDSLLDTNNDRGNNHPANPPPSDLSVQQPSRPPKTSGAQPVKVNFKPSAPSSGAMVSKGPLQLERKPSIHSGLTNGAVNGHKEKQYEMTTPTESKAPKIKLSFGKKNL